jgi:hypothetical protein
VSVPPFDEPLLSERDALPQELALGLERLRDKRPSPERLVAMAAAVGLAATAGTASAATTTSGAAEGTFGLGSPAAKVLLVTGVVTAGAVALLLLRTPSTAPVAPVAVPSSVSVAAGSSSSASAPSDAPARARPPVAAPSAPGASPAEGAVPAEPAAVVAPSVTAEAPLAGRPQHEPSPPTRPAAEAPASPVGVAAPAVARSAPRAATRPHVASPTSNPRAEKSTEVELLRDARQVLDRNPLVALSLCDEHQRDYPGGGLTQERELIAVAALLRLGRSSSAESRAARFRASYPSSPYLPRLDRLVPP